MFIGYNCIAGIVGIIALMIRPVELVANDSSLRLA
jgi:hypothetical protein